MAESFYDDCASEVTEIYKIQTMAPDAKEWKDLNLSFAYSEDDHSYTAALEASAMPAGTKMRYLVSLIPGKEHAVQYSDKPAKLTYKSTKTVTAYNFSDEDLSDTDISGNPYLPTVSTYYPADTTTIVSDASSVWDKNKLANDVETIQKNCFQPVSDPVSLTRDGFGAVYLVNFDTTSFGTDNALVSGDFIITTSGELGYKKVEATVTAADKNDKGNITYVIETNDKKYKTADLKLWVGPGTELKENTTNANQVKFGLPKDASKGDASGYVLLK